MRLIDEKGEQLGVVPTLQALKLAQERSLDLVEVSPTAVPPVCRLLDYGKFRYAQTKKEREARKGQKVVSLREVRIRPRIGEHDIEAKSRQVKKLLEEGAKVKVAVMFRGREITHPELGVGLLKRITEGLQNDAKLERAPALEGRILSIILAPAARQHDGARKTVEETGSAEAENTQGG